MSSDELPPRQQSRTVVDKESGLTLMPIRQHVEEESAGWVGRLKAFGVLCILWGYYMAFGIVWLELFTAMGDDLLWMYFGVFVVVASSMGLGVARSMSAQRIGWWRKTQRKRDSRGTCCGFELY